MFCLYRSLILFLFCMKIQINAENIQQFLTSSYSQVSRSGANSQDQVQGRSNGQKPWTHSSDAHIVRGQNLALRKKNDRRNSFRNKNEKTIEGSDIIGSGEVIQERFNPKPWFAYETIGDKGPTYVPPAPTKPNNKNPDLTVSVPFDSFPMALKPPDKQKPSPLLKPPFENNNSENTPPLNTYGSPYDSYHPNLEKITTSPSNFVTQPPKYLPPEPEDHKPHKFHEVMDTSLKYLPPESEKPQDGYIPSENVNSPTNHHPENIDSVEDEDDFSPQSHSQHFKYNEDFHHDEMPVMPINDDISELHYPSAVNHEQDHGYSLDHHHIHDHPPIYYEVKTTTEAPADQRLNKRPYSYYYLGRKLYYVPLYFSVYFIIYVFVLILKSIARHKITFSHYFEEDKREMKDMHEEHVHEIDDHVYHNINAAKRKYIM